MARVITGAMYAPAVELDDHARRRAQARLDRQAATNRLRRVHLACETSGQRDPIARVGDLVWCNQHGDFARVVSVVE